MLGVTLSHAQSAATIQEYDTTFLTYPFSDPNPIPRTGKIYPYFTFDGYSTEAVERSWKMVELENDYLRVQITPEIGGKIWSAIDKIQNKPFIYANDVVKFRNIAMRGPWTSGGIEFNFGIIGHTPTVSTPIDYHTMKKKDGSVSCYISALDLLTRTRWIVEINLPKDKALFSTKVHWTNPTDLEQPYYTWMNLAVPAREDLHFLDPGTHYITHGGQARSWPIDSTRQTDLSVYVNNAFDGSKSYHITGKHSDFFGTYYEKTDDGMIHLADRDAKSGKKVFLWALSEAGHIWETLLSDQAGQYVEVQSGRLFNQNSYTSSRTPFKQIGFPPLQTDQWTEYWFPYHGIGSVDFADRHGVWHFDRSAAQLGIDIMGLTTISDTLQITMIDGFVVKKPMEVHPLKPQHIVFMINPDQIARINFGETQIIPEWTKATDLNRPLTIPADFDQSGSYARYLQGHDAARFRLYDQAEKHIRASLSQDSFFIPALTEMAQLQYRKMQYDSAYFYARRALSVNTYDPQANYYYGLAASELGKSYDAKDGWEVAALSPAWRMAAWYQLAAVYFREKNWAMARNYVDKILDIQPANPQGIKIKLVLDRLRNTPVDLAVIDQLSQIDPDNHFVAFEHYLRSPNQHNLDAFQSGIQNELPEQTYLEMAIWYAVKLNRPQDAVKLLKLAPDNNLSDFWLAYLTRTETPPSRTLNQANQGDPRFVFPFRRESLPVLMWTASESNHWKPKYYLALIFAHAGKTQFAKDILFDLPDDTGFAPLYIWRSSFQNQPTEVEKDLRLALSIDPGNWRYLLTLADFLMKQNQLNEATTILTPYYEENTKNYQAGMALAQLHLMKGTLEIADHILREIHVLPYEGASEGRRLYQAVKLNLALNALSKKEYDIARDYLTQSKLWPTNLGVGKPYENLINTALEDQITTWVEAGESGNPPSENQVKALADKIKSRFFQFKEQAPF